MFLSFSTILKCDCFEVNAWKKVAGVLYSEWPQKENITK